MKKRMITTWILALCLLLCSCKPAATETETKWVYAMNTMMSFRLEGDDGTVFAMAEDLVGDLEEIFSTTWSKSEIYRLNETGSATLSADAAAVLEAGLLLSEKTEQAFCLSLYPATRLWGFTDETKQVPAAEALEAVRPVVDDTLIQVEGKTVTLPKGGALDFGGIAKGYTADLLTILMEEQQIEHYFLSLGGNVQVGGGNPDGSPWRIGIADPDGGDYLGVLELTDGAVVTSGGYQRNFEENGKVYHHILDRTTLSPAESGLKSVTIVGESGTLADGLSTALFVMGEERAMAFCKEQGDFECILVTEDDRILLSDGLKGSFVLNNPQYALA